MRNASPNRPCGGIGSIVRDHEIAALTCCAEWRFRKGEGSIFLFGTKADLEQMFGFELPPRPTIPPVEFDSDKITGGPELAVAYLPVQAFRWGRGWKWECSRRRPSPAGHMRRAVKCPPGSPGLFFCAPAGPCKSRLPVGHTCCARLYAGISHQLYRQPCPPGLPGQVPARA